MTITELIQLKIELSEKKRVIDRKIFVIDNLISTSLFIENYESRRKETEKHWRIKHGDKKHKNRERSTQRTKTDERSGQTYRGVCIPPPTQ